ncbi:RAP protein, putative [Plasmodium chabaudi chabaudi]|uniref:RAP protein, putative n=1 Tax=Plasmodium chabaudi chabaudi TaxID=31271 RepID=A0A1D3LI38_PLACU|nr:RAP protein, putative [Plasmodium chabaudi chabaudi]
MVLRRSKDVLAKSTQCRSFCNNRGYINNRFLNYIQGNKQIEYRNHHTFKNTNNLNIRNNGINHFEKAAKQFIATNNIRSPFSNKSNNFSSNNFSNSNDDNNNGEVEEENYQTPNEQEDNINMNKNNICAEKTNESNNIDNGDNQEFPNSEQFNDKDYSNNVNNINNSEEINDKDTTYTDNTANAQSENIMENDEDIPNIFDVDENLTEEEKKEKLKLIKLITEKLAGPLKTNNENNIKTDENSKNDDDFIFADNRPIAIEVDGPSHFYANSNRYTTYTKLKHRILTKLGYNVIHISYFDWRKLRNKSEREEFILKKLKEKNDEFLDENDRIYYNERMKMIKEDYMKHMNENKEMNN